MQLSQDGFYLVNKITVVAALMTEIWVNAYEKSA
jgi:hypothetical protein